jgi:queuine tRNA-ribosyltransferase
LRLLTECSAVIAFALNKTETSGRARRGTLRTAHGAVETPAFMPVGSVAAVKGIDVSELQAMGFGLILANAYHLFLRPGHRLVADLGGLHAFMSWPGAILTDSGGFQVFSLADLRQVSDDGVTFRSHLDGSSHHISPERAIEIQEALGADIIMAFDECVALPAPADRVKHAVLRTNEWARRCLAARRRTDQGLFGIVQGGLDADLRVKAARDLVSLGFDGYAIGGLSVGEDNAAMYAMLDITLPELPVLRPRYLMGVGMPEDIVEAVARGIDLFDCVVPTRHGRTGWLFTSFGRVIIKQAQYARDDQPIDPGCQCPVCCRHSRAYLHHLYVVKDMLGPRLNTLHNLYYFADLMKRIRESIQHDRFAAFRQAFYATRIRQPSEDVDLDASFEAEELHKR